MYKRLSIYLSTLTAIVLFAACNEEKSSSLEYVYASTQVKSFKLAPEDSILNNIDSVFFSIDLVNARIFNADSLPFGTKVDQLGVNLTTDACSVIDLIFKSRYSGKDTTVNYMTSSTELINFSAGPVKLHLVSYDGSAQRDYSIEVNVHKVVGDTLYWDKTSRRALPSSLSDVTAQKTTRFADKAICLTSGDGGKYCLASTSDPADDSWSYKSVTFPFTPILSSFEATDEALYILSSTNVLYRSADMGSSWQSTGASMSHIIGAYESKLLGVNKGSDGKYRHVSFVNPTAYPGNEISDNFPVAGTSQLVKFDSRWSAAPQLTMVGGTLADGKPTNATWSYDGKSWACLSTAFPVKATGVTLLSYIIASTDTLDWTHTQTPALIAFGGVVDNTNPASSGSVNRKVYVSRDFGVNWALGGDNIQLPAYLPVGRGAQALVYDTQLTASRSTRAVKPITSWSAPFIYLFGGFNGSVFYDNLFKGVITSLTFKPLQ